MSTKKECSQCELELTDDCPRYGGAVSCREAEDVVFKGMGYNMVTDKLYNVPECPRCTTPVSTPTSQTAMYSVIPLSSLPSAQPKLKKGKWNTYYHGVNENPSFTYSCNQCGYSAPYGLYGGKYSQKKWAYCPNCGADMRGERGEQDDNSGQDI